ncbi:MAG: cell division protein FtsZ, partial [Candidatus Riflebacteria bacterium]
DQDANIIFGHAVNEDMGDTLKITVIATGFGEEVRSNIDPKRRMMEELRTINRPQPIEIPQPMPTQQVVNGMPSYNNSDEKEIPAFLRKRRRI